MYYFEDTEKKEHIDELRLPSSAMLYDGLYFEKIIEGYRTLAVTGREMLSVEIERQETRTGSIKLNQKLPSRSIRVTYQLMGKNPEDTQSKYHQLMQLLYREEDVEIRFRDEGEYSYFGIYNSSEEVPGTTNSIVSSFEIFCQNPRKYSQMLNTNNEITAHLPYKTTPEKIEVTVAVAGGLIVKNGEKEIKMTGKTFTSGDKVTIDFRQGRILLNGVDKTLLLDLDSDFENFYIQTGDRLSCSNGLMKIFYREVLL
ncbi:distal tail protein Dit [Enterococcus sp. LJL51]|uniref:distal tail protein Dit n=1 Tax=Enterococcus sp. LJL51 TaxID=3416656 RepID=UPI003CFAEA34